ncbi:phage holin family protein [Radiobacillus sp. PE A8.2]|uniref:phage holin family protein n=1 Tax=Radiobacillus sp. PE A8.2 TaxID=3380349 RepID=UPI00388E7967
MLKKWLLSLLFNAVALVVVAQLFDSFIVEGFGTALLASLILSILNTIVRPILVVLTLPITIISLGLFLFVINALTLMITQSLIGTAFEINGFGTAFVAAIILSLINLILNRLFKDSLKD